MEKNNFSGIQGVPSIFFFNLSTQQEVCTRRAATNVHKHDASPAQKRDLVRHDVKRDSRSRPLQLPVQSSSSAKLGRKTGVTAVPAPLAAVAAPGVKATDDKCDLPA